MQNGIKKVQASPTGDAVTPELPQNYEKTEFLATEKHCLKEILTIPIPFHVSSPNSLG